MWTAENRQQYERQGLRYPSDVTDAEWDIVGRYLTSEASKCGPTPERSCARFSTVFSMF